MNNTHFLAGTILTINTTNGGRMEALLVRDLDRSSVDHMVGMGEAALAVEANGFWRPVRLCCDRIASVVAA